MGESCNAPPRLHAWTPPMDVKGRRRELGREDAGGPNPFTIRCYESHAPAAKNLRDPSKKEIFFYTMTNTLYEAREPYSQTKRLRPHCVMPQSSEGHFLETITWPQNDEASRVQSQPVTVHVWLTRYCLPTSPLQKAQLQINLQLSQQYPVPPTASCKRGSPNRLTDVRSCPRHEGI